MRRVVPLLRTCLRDVCFGESDHAPGRISSATLHAHSPWAETSLAMGSKKPMHEKSSFAYQVYPVEGGMEDWSYAAGWESSPMPITVCRPNTYGGYAEDQLNEPRGL